MSIINFKDFTDSETLKKSILEVANKLFKYKYDYHVPVIDIMISELCSKISIKKLNENSNKKYWEKSWGPIEPCMLTPKHKDSYYIYIKKYNCSKKISISVLSVHEYIKKYFCVENSCQWLINNKIYLENENDCCCCSPCNHIR